MEKLGIGYKPPVCIPLTVNHQRRLERSVHRIGLRMKEIMGECLSRCSDLMIADNCHLSYGMRAKKCLYLVIWCINRPLSWRALEPGFSERLQIRRTVHPLSRDRCGTRWPLSSIRVAHGDYYATDSRTRRESRHHFRKPGRGAYAK